MLGFLLENLVFNAVFASATSYPPLKKWVPCCWVSCIIWIRVAQAFAGGPSFTNPLQSAAAVICLIIDPPSFHLKELGYVEVVCHRRGRGGIDRFALEPVRRR